MKTKRTEVQAKIAIWAIPNNYAEEGELPFTYTAMMGSGTPWQDGSVKVMAREELFVVPAGIDLLAKAIETLKGEIQKTRAEAASQVKKYEMQMESLLQLTYQPEGIVDDMTGLVS
jgi:hypothetical protein